MATLLSRTPQGLVECKLIYRPIWEVVLGKEMEARCQPGVQISHFVEGGILGFGQQLRAECIQEGREHFQPSPGRWQVLPAGSAYVPFL